MPRTECAATGLHAWLMPQVAALPGISTGSRVLDLGCGTGAWLQRLRDWGFSYLTGIDRNGSDFSSDASFILGDLNQPIRTELGTFDLVTAIEVIEHLANPEALIALAATHLAANGWLVITTPNIYSLRWRTRFLLTGTLHGFDVGNDPTHIHPLILKPMRSVISKYDLTLAKMLTYDDDSSRWFARLAERALSLLLPNDLPGNNLCLFLRKH